MKNGQTQRLYSLLSDGNPHDTIDILNRVYGGEHLGIARISARIWDLKKKGYIIESWKDKERKSIWYYKMITPPFF